MILVTKFNYEQLYDENPNAFFSRAKSEEGMEEMPWQKVYWTKGQIEFCLWNYPEKTEIAFCDADFDKNWVETSSYWRSEV